MSRGWVVTLAHHTLDEGGEGCRLAVSKWATDAMVEQALVPVLHVALDVAIEELRAAEQAKAEQAAESPVAP